LQDHGRSQRALSAAIVAVDTSRNLCFDFGCLAKNEACLKFRQGRQMFDFVIVHHGLSPLDRPDPNESGKVYHCAALNGFSDGKTANRLTDIDPHSAARGMACRWLIFAVGVGEVLDSKRHVESSYLALRRLGRRG
jgi:hypothetical protein